MEGCSDRSFEFNKIFVVIHFVIMASSNTNITVRMSSSRRSSEPFSLVVVVDGYCHCFFCDLLTEFDKNGVATTPGLKCGPCGGVEGILSREETSLYSLSVILPVLYMCRSASSHEGYIVDT